MADLFISYAKPDWQLVARLAAFLELQGWSVWWDRNLQPGERYRTEIADEIAAARAVLVLWTPASVGSDWVRAEAGAARNTGKLIPLKTAEVGYADIPMPFGELHTEDVGREEAIALAVSAQLAARPVAPVGLARGLAEIKYQLLTWLGILGGAMTLFSNMANFMQLAHWSSWLVSHWRELTQAVAVWPLGWIGIRLPAAWAPTMVFGLFCCSIVAGVLLNDRRRREEIASRAWHTAKVVAVYIGLSAGLALFLVGLDWLHSRGGFRIDVRTEGIWIGSTVFLLIFILPLAQVIFAWRHVAVRLASYLLICTFFILLALAPSAEAIDGFMATDGDTDRGAFLMIATVVGLNSLLLCALFLPNPPLLLKRLSFLGLGLLALLTLDTVSRWVAPAG